MANARPGSGTPERTRILVRLNKGIRCNSWTCFAAGTAAKAAGTRNSIAVIVEYIRFLRKQVTGGRNGLAGKAMDMRWQVERLPEHISQKTY